MTLRLNQVRNKHATAGATDVVFSNEKCVKHVRVCMCVCVFKGSHILFFMNWKLEETWERTRPYLLQGTKKFQVHLYIETLVENGFEPNTPKLSVERKGLKGKKGRNLFHFILMYCLKVFPEACMNFINLGKGENSLI